MRGTAQSHEVVRGGGMPRGFGVFPGCRLSMGMGYAIA